MRMRGPRRVHGLNAERRARDLADPQGIGPRTADLDDVKLLACGILALDALGAALAAAAWLLARIRTLLEGLP